VKFWGLTHTLDTFPGQHRGHPLQLWHFTLPQGANWWCHELNLLSQQFNEDDIRLFHHIITLLFFCFSCHFCEQMDRAWSDLMDHKNWMFLLTTSAAYNTASSAPWKLSPMATFPSTCICRRSDGSLDHTIQEADPHQLLSDAESCHHPLNKHSMLYTLAHSYCCLCPGESPRRIEFHYSMFK
jgi:hypothetical protein